MPNERKNESNREFYLRSFLENEKRYSQKWTTKKVDNEFVADCLSTASKKCTDEHGEPDLIYINENRKLLILLENKNSISDHTSKTGNHPMAFAVDGIVHYLSFFTTQKLKNKQLTTQNFFKDWRIIGIAFSGDINDVYNHQTTTFRVSNNDIIDCKINEILNENDYLALFENIDLEEISNNISKSSADINKLLRSIDSQKRPILLSALMICLYEKEGYHKNDFKNSYIHWNADTIAENIPNRVAKTLKEEDFPDEKIKILIKELAFLETDISLNHSGVLKEILQELENKVIPLFSRKSNYDIIGKFYEEFLRFAGVTNVKKGIVLTPHHITKLFTELIDIKLNDVIFDCCCGTGAFLVAGMNKIIEKIEHSTLQEQSTLIEKVKQNQLIGFELNSTMYTLAVSNMMFRGDGKSRIFHTDFFSKDAEKILEDLKKQGIAPTIGFINPPYSGKDNKDNPTKKEIQFLERFLDKVSRYVVIIAPLSTFFKEDLVRNRILSKHTLKMVINMPNDLFMPNAATNTAIAVFETHLPHNNKEVLLYDLKEDGFVLSKNKGRTDVYNKWNDIKTNLLEQLHHPEKYVNGINFVKTNIQEDDEWIIQAHAKTDYSKLIINDFMRSIQSHVIFNLKRDLNLFGKKIDEIEMMEILSERLKIGKNKINRLAKVDTTKWEEFTVESSQMFHVKGSKTTPLLTLEGFGIGDYPYVTTQATNNGTAGFFDYFTEEGNCLTIDSAVVGYCSYQHIPFSASDHVELLIPRFSLNKYIALFIVTMLNMEQFRYSYGRKFNQTRIKKTKIKLPAKNGTPDWQLMEDYIKSLPYSKFI